jgi:thioredoxin-dependent peroxiredoxin
MSKELLGRPAPGFELPDAAGKIHRLLDFQGKKVIVYFYPKDDTPGCTKEACAFRDLYEDFKEADAVVIGISKDTAASHTRFREKYSLPFLLLSDPDNAVAKNYGAYGEKMMYGKPVLGTIRSTFIIGEDGQVKKQWSSVKVDGHVEEVLKTLRDMD